jgi:hypothetical protein
MVGFKIIQNLSNKSGAIRKIIFLELLVSEDLFIVKKNNQIIIENSFTKFIVSE